MNLSSGYHAFSILATDAQGNVQPSSPVLVTVRKLPTTNQTFTITPTAGANGAISPNTAQSVSSGGSQTFTATANTGYTVNSWSVDGSVAQSGGTTFTLYDITANHSVTVTFTLLALSAVSLSASPASPRVTGTAITLTAIPTANGGQVTYLFRAGYTDAAGWHWTNLNSAYTTTATCTWTPSTAGPFTLVVWARLAGHTANYDQYATLPYQVNYAPLTAVALSATPAAPRPSARRSR